MSYLLDADWVISFLNGRPNAVQLVEKLANRGLAISIITWGEVYEGLIGLPSFARHMVAFEELTATTEIISLDTEVARRYAVIRSDLRSRGLLLADNDLWIAATALARDLTLVSRDQHFERIPGLKLHQG
ncbi:MAG: type II toxin-antitoxin system VapC family toxin [Chloroflexi bacterium]|nr:type II toxin-antitoxin system VapC family toxin [Chloroflexota bacterium]